MRSTPPFFSANAGVAASSAPNQTAAHRSRNPCIVFLILCAQILIILNTLKDYLDVGWASLAEGIKLWPEMNLIVNFRDLRPYYSSRKELQLEDHTVTEGLRRLGFPEG